MIPAMVPNDLGTLAHTTPRPAFLPPEDGYLMFVGALGPHKGVDVLLEARRRMRSGPPLVLIGTPRADTPQVSDPGVVVAHNIPSAQVMASWTPASAADVPLWWNEPTGAGGRRGNACRTCSGRLRRRRAARHSLEHGITGLVVPPGDPGALATALDSLLDDPQAQRRLGDAGRLRARQFEATAVAPRIVETFREVLHQRALAHLVWQSPFEG